MFCKGGKVCRWINVNLIWASHPRLFPIKAIRKLKFHLAFNWVAIMSYSDIALPTVQRTPLLCFSAHPHEGRLAALWPPEEMHCWAKYQIDRAWKSFRNNPFNTARFLFQLLHRGAWIMSCSQRLGVSERGCVEPFSSIFLLKQRKTTAGN